jgi:hypothetical protein
MQPNDAEGLSPHDRSIEQLDKRDVRALTEPMTVMSDVGRADGADGLFTVVSHTGNNYLVDIHHGRCECPDMEYRDPDGGCKHVRRVRFVTGKTPIPAWINPDAVDDCLGTAVDTTPHVAATDGGELLEDSDIVDDDRPDDCDCADWNSDVELPCWPCYREGFRTVASDK